MAASHLEMSEKKKVIVNFFFFLKPMAEEAAAKMSGAWSLRCCRLYGRSKERKRRIKQATNSM